MSQLLEIYIRILYNNVHNNNNGRDLRHIRKPLDTFKYDYDYVKYTL